MFRKHVLPYVIWAFYSLLAFTWRKRIIEPPEMADAIKNHEPIILAHWHGDELAVLHLVKRYRVCTMTSASADGQLIRFVIEKFGGETAEGSSTRGGATALKGLVRLLREGRVGSVAVDGPKGPLHEVKPGVFELARLAHAPIYPLGVAVSSGFVFQKSWNKAVLPRPFARVVMQFTPALIAPDQGDPKDPRLKAQLESALFEARRLADQTASRRDLHDVS